MEMRFEKNGGWINGKCSDEQKNNENVVQTKVKYSEMYRHLYVYVCACVRV